MSHKVGIVGSINVDMTLITERIPHKGETLLGENVIYSAGGKGANQAVAAAQAGAEVTMFGCVGADSNGEKMIDNLLSYGVKTAYIDKLEGVSTGLAVITVGEKDNTIIVIPGANSLVNCEYIDKISSELKKMDIVLIQQEIPEAVVDYVVDFCHENGIMTMLNPAPARDIRKETIEKVNYLTPNEHETKLIFQEENLETVLKKYPEKLVVTLGSKGAAACSRTGELIKVNAGKVNVCDTTGAGDTFNGILAAMIAGKMSLEDAMLYANAGAGLSTEKMGAQGGMPSFEEIQRSLNGSGRDEKPVYNS